MQDLFGSIGFVLKVITTEVRYTFQSMGAVGLKHTEVMQIILPGMTEHCYMEHIQAWMYGMARYILPAPFPLTSSTNIPWMNMEYDVSNLSGNNVSFRFRQVSDGSVNYAGWYVDDIGLEVDWFETEGSWRSPLVSTEDLGYGFVDADIILPTNTWYGVDILDASGQVIQGHENMSLPLSLASIDRDTYPNIYIEVNMGASMMNITLL